VRGLGYSLKYEQGVVKTTFNENKIKIDKKRITITVLGCVIVAILMLSGKSNEMREYIFPGNADVTEAALNTLITDIKDGESLGDAISAFCKEIYINATYYR
jgi:hypothetical protein